MATAKKINRARGKTRLWQIGTVWSRGRPPKDDRLMVTAMFFILRTGIPWRDLPARFGPWSSVYTRFRRWCAAGRFARILALVARNAKGQLRYVDCSHIKLHQAGANPRGGQSAQAIGRTKGGINTKLAAIVERHGRAVALGLAAGQRHDLYAVEPLLPCLRRRRAVADKAFDADTFRPDFAGKAHAYVFLQNARAAGPRLSIAATTVGVTMSKTSFAASSATAASALAMRNSPLLTSPSSSSPPSLIGSLIAFEDTP